MDAIKKQVDAIVVYKGETFAAVNAEYNDIKDRISEGLDKMKDAMIFSDAEINSIRKYAMELLGIRYRVAKDALTKTQRASFQF
jgi:hypothetical protein